MYQSLLLPGTLAKSKWEEDEEDRLILWPSYKTISCEKEVDSVSNKELLLILKVRKTRKINKNLSDEWQKGSYLVLTSNGVSGWVGEGWIVPV